MQALESTQFACASREVADPLRPHPCEKANPVDSISWRYTKYIKAKDRLKIGRSVAKLEQAWRCIARRYVTRHPRQWTQKVVLLYLSTIVSARGLLLGINPASLSLLRPTTTRGYAQLPWSGSVPCPSLRVYPPPARITATARSGEEPTMLMMFSLSRARRNLEANLH